MLISCVLVGLNWAEPMMFLLLHVICSCIFNAYVPLFFYLIDIDIIWYSSVCVSLSLFLSDSLCMAPKCKSTPSQNPFHSGASSSPNSTPLHVRFRNEKARQDFSENFSRRGIHSKHQVLLLDFSNTDLLTIIHSRGWESLCDTPVSFPSVIIQEFYSNMHKFDSSIPRFLTSIRGIHIVVTPELISDVLYVLRVSHPDYPDCPHLQIVSKDELMSLFCETPSSWGDHQNTHCSGFTKGPRFLNMVMTFVLHPLSHYNLITEPCAQFLLSLLEGLTIDFPSHFILSLIDVYKDTTTRDKLIFLSAITRIIRHASVSYLEFAHFSIMGAISGVSIRWSEAQLWPKRPWT